MSDNDNKSRSYNSDDPDNDLVHINHDPNDPLAYFINPQDFLPTIPDDEPNNSSSNSVKTKDKKLQLLDDNLCMRMESCLTTGFDSKNLTTSSSYKEILSTLRKQCTSKEMKVWNDMANIGNHLAIREERQLFNALGLTISDRKEMKKRKLVDINDPANAAEADAEREQQERRAAKKKSKAERDANTKEYARQMKDYLASGSEIADTGSVSDGLAQDFTGVQLSGPSDASGGATPWNTPPVAPKPLAELSKAPDFVPFRRISVEQQGMRQMENMISHANVSLWKSAQTVYTCDGKPLLGLDFSLPQVDAQHLCNEIRNHQRPKVVWEKLGVKEVDDKELKLLEGPCTIVDSQGVPLVIHLPNFYLPEFVTNMTASAIKLKNETSPAKDQADSKKDARGDPESYVDRNDQKNFPTGTLNLASAWVSLGKKHPDDELGKDTADDIAGAIESDQGMGGSKATEKAMEIGTTTRKGRGKGKGKGAGQGKGRGKGSRKAKGGVSAPAEDEPESAALKAKAESGPSLHMIAGGKTAVVAGHNAVQNHFAAAGPLLTLQNYALFKRSPTSFWAHFKVRCRLRARSAAVRAAGANDPSMLSGRSYIYNRSTRAHFDEKEAPEGWAPLTVLGDCTTGALSLPHLGVKLKYLPGCLTFVRGRLLKHGVVDWKEEGNRICIANFNHLTEWDNAGVQPVF